MNKFISKIKLMRFRNKNVYDDGDSNLFSYHYFNNCSFSKNNSIYKINSRKRSNFRSKTFRSKYNIKFDIHEISNYNKSFNVHQGGKLI